MVHGANIPRQPARSGNLVNRLLLLRRPSADRGGQPALEFGEPGRVRARQATLARDLRANGDDLGGGGAFGIAFFRRHAASNLTLVADQRRPQVMDPHPF